MEFVLGFEPLHVLLLLSDLGVLSLREVLELGRCHAALSFFGSSLVSLGLQSLLKLEVLGAGGLHFAASCDLARRCFHLLAQVSEVGGVIIASVS